MSATTEYTTEAQWRGAAAHNDVCNDDLEYTILLQVREKNNDACRCLHAGDGLSANQLLQDALSTMKQHLDQKPLQTSVKGGIHASSSTPSSASMTYLVHGNGYSDTSDDATCSSLDNDMSEGGDEDMTVTEIESNDKIPNFSMGVDDHDCDGEEEDNVDESYTGWEVLETVALPTTATTTPPPSLPIHTYSKVMLISRHQLECYDKRAIVAMLCYNLALVHHHHNRQSYDPAIRFYELSGQILVQLEATVSNDNVHDHLTLLLQTAIANNLACCYASQFIMPSAIRWFQHLQFLTRHALMDSEDQTLFFLNSSVVQAKGIDLAPAA